MAHCNAQFLLAGYAIAAVLAHNKRQEPVHSQNPMKPHAVLSVQVLPAVADALALAECQLLQTIGATCGHAAFAELLQLLNEALEDDAQSAKNTFLNR